MNRLVKIMSPVRFRSFIAATLVIIMLAVTACFFNAAPSECIKAAEEAGLSDDAIEQLRNPGDLNAIERAALRQTLDRAGIDDVCEMASADGSSSASQDISLPNQDDEDQPHPANKEPLETKPSQERRPNQQYWQVYAECLDDVYLRASDDYDGYHWLSAAIWYCRELEPAPTAVAAVARCNLNQIEATQQQYPEWAEILHRWHAIAVCNPRPTPDSTHIRTISDIQPTAFGACLDNAYLGIGEMIDHHDVTIGISSWLCQDYLPEPPGSHRQRCDLNHIAEAQEIYPEWPEALRNWHAIMQCLPEWEWNQDPGESVYATCLGDVYWQVADRYPKDHAIPAAVWRCRDYMPEPPTAYNPRCEINHLQRDEESQLQWPDELYAWNAIVQCYPKYRT